MGALLVVAVVAIAILVPSREGRRLAGTPSLIPLPADPVVGDCLLEPTGERREPGRSGGRPAELFRFRARALEITDQFAVLRPPAES